MNRTPPLLWISLFLLILLPTAAGRFLIDLAGGLIIIIFTLPLFLGGLGWIGWKLIQSRMITCEVCGSSTFDNSPQCPICGSSKVSQGNYKNSNSQI